MVIDRCRLLAGLAVVGALATAPLAVSIVPAAAAEPSPAAVPADPQTYDIANCDQPEFKNDGDFQNWCARVRWASDLMNPANPNSLLNPNNPLNPNSVTNPNNPVNPNSPLNPRNQH
ncbi:hypothetical protein [Nocardia heshunensis]